jgi:hypothetical protein
MEANYQAFIKQFEGCESRARTLDPTSNISEILPFIDKSDPKKTVVAFDFDQTITEIQKQGSEPTMSLERPLCSLFLRYLTLRYCRRSQRQGQQQARCQGREESTRDAGVLAQGGHPVRHCDGATDHN